jgi:CheY-like chemotaxis protein
MAGTKPTSAGSEILADRHRVTVETRLRDTIKDVLVVEDSKIDGDRMRATLHLVLGREVQIRRAETLASAIDCVLEKVPDLVFLDDYLKPSDSATDTIPYIRRAGYDGYIIVVSGEVDRHRRAKLIELGATDAIHKDEVDSSVVQDVLGRLPGIAEDL